jgi:hypothetical protein
MEHVIEGVLIATAAFVLGLALVSILAGRGTREPLPSAGQRPMTATTNRNGRIVHRASRQVRAGGAEVHLSVSQ